MQTRFEGSTSTDTAEPQQPTFDPSLLFPGRRTPTAVHFDAFPMGRWEVAWLGNVGFPQRHAMFSQPTVTVVLRSLDDRSCAPTEIQVPIAQLFALYLGSIWQDKVRTDECSDVSESREISFLSDRAISCAVGVGLEDELNGQFMLPFSDFPYHSGHTKGWCLRVQMPRAIYVFPALELIRFYFGSSGSLLKHVFNPGFKVERVATENGLIDGLGKVTLAHDIPAASATDVARIAFDPRALAAARLVGFSLQAAAALDAYGKLYPKAALPFFGRTDMKVLGIPVQAQSALPRFVVQRIVSCGAAFPFQRLQFVASGTTKKRFEPKTGPATSESTSPHPPKAAVRRTTGPLVNSEPKRAASTQRMPLEHGNRFPDLSRKPVSRVDGDSARQVQLSHLPPVDFGSSGEGKSSAEGKRCDPTVNADQRKALWKFKSPLANWESYFLFLRWLAHQPWVGHLCFAPIDSRQAQPHYCALPELIDDDGVLIEGTLLRHGKQRLASAVNLLVDGQPIAIFSISPALESGDIALDVLTDFAFTAGGGLPAVAAILTKNGLVGTPLCLPVRLESHEVLERAGQALQRVVNQQRVKACH